MNSAINWPAAQVGGKPTTSFSFRFGGVAYVSPPQRPGAQLWSIAAGPLVNVALDSRSLVLVSVSSHLGWDDTHPDLYQLDSQYLDHQRRPADFQHDAGLSARRRANPAIAALVSFRPREQPDGRQHHWLYWRGRIVILIVAYFCFFPDKTQSIWLGASWRRSFSMNCWGGLKQARALARIARMPRREGFACPSCKTAPPLGDLWRCGKCGHAFDISRPGAVRIAERNSMSRNASTAALQRADGLGSMREASAERNNALGCRRLPDLEGIR